tara:strand:- start:728 stop:1933 length:1206 start_codon:yes stop_codon:yes gene_type:complete
MNELDKLIEGHFGVKSSFATSDLLDMVTQLLEKNNLGTTELSAASDPKKLKSVSGDSSGQKLLDIADISRKLIRGTESSARLQSVEDAFEILRKTNPYIDQLTSTSPENFPFAIIEALNYYFSPPKEILENPCVGIGAMMTRHLILDAYLSIFEEYNSTSAGFANESFIAGLLGGQTISVIGGHTSIADFQLGNNAYGISLKTASSEGKLTGSFANLMRTLGIKYRSRTGSKAHRSDNDKPVHEKGLYYLLFNKKKSSHTITCFRVDREAIIGRLDRIVPKHDDGYYVFDSVPTKRDLSFLTGVLEAKFDNIISNSTFGVSSVATAEEDIKLILPEVSSADDENVAKIIETITALTEFYAIFSNAVIQFATDPDYEVLAQIKKNLELAAQFEPEKLLSGKC